MSKRLLLSACLALAAAPAVRAQLIISEFLASNENGLRDEDQSREDWIEIYNPTASPVPLAGWYLTDNAGRLRNWAFPDITLAAGGRLLVFASDKRRTGATLHTNFKLSASGEYLALTKDDGQGGVTVVTEFAPAYPPQAPDVSYGTGKAVIVGPGSPAKGIVPASATAPAAAWREPGFDDSAWQSGTMNGGVGGDPAAVSAAALKLRLNAASAATLASDTSGVAHHGTNPASSTAWVNRASDQAEEPMTRSGVMQFFAASPSQVRVPAHADFNSTRGTIMFWMKSAGVSGGGAEGAILWDRRTTAGNVIVQTVDGRLYSQPIGGGWFYSGALVSDNRWHHVAFTFNGAAGGTDAFWIDGAMRGSLAHATAWSWPPAQQVELGQSHDAYWYRYNGLMDDVRYYNTVLTGDDIRQIYSGADETVAPADIGLNLAGMNGVNASAYFRVPFTITNPSLFPALQLNVRAGDGFIAWLNGQRVASWNVFSDAGWDATSIEAGQPGRHLSYSIPVTPDLLRQGENILALQAVKESVDDPALFIAPQLEGGEGAGAPQYLTSPTPGSPNSEGRADIGPFIADVTASPPRPAGGAGSAPIPVLATVTPSLRALAGENPVQLAWRTMFGPETVIPMTPSGTANTWVAEVPTAQLTPGQMLRWRVIATDQSGVQSTDPPFPDPLTSDQYHGTVSADTISTQLPVYHLFAENYTPNNTTNTHPIDNDGGGRASFYFNGELYDNVFVRIKGDTTRLLRKRAHRVDFNDSHQLNWLPGRPRLRELALNAEYVDPSYARQYMAFWLHRATGTGAPEHFPVRAQMNGEFWQLVYATETADSELLENMGLDRDGALYASVGQMNAAGGEKQTRTWENSADMSSFITAVTASNPATRRTNVFDRVDLPAVINYLAVARITQEGDDVWANMTIYRHTNTTGEWRIVPFDTNLSWGQLFYGDSPATNGVIHATNDQNKSHPLYGNTQARVSYASDRYNRFYDAIISVPETRAMLLRRMRSIMDGWIKPPGTANAPVEAELDALVAKITPEGGMDRTKWGWPPVGGPYGLGNQPHATAITQFKNQFLVPRRVHFYTTHSVTNTAKPIGLSNASNAGIPEAQPDAVPVTLASWDANPAGSTTQREEYIELANPNTFAADISGWSLTGAVQFTFHGGTVIPAGGSLYASPNATAFRARTASPKGGEGRFVTGPYAGQLSSRGETIELRDAAGTLVTSAAVPPAPSLAQQFLRISELHFHPADPTFAETIDLANVTADDFEFVELINTGTAPLDLAGVRFTEGIEFTFPPGATLAAGARTVLVTTPAAFAARYGTGITPGGTFTGTLDNAGERLQLVDAAGEVILDFDYSDDWFPPADGDGYSLVLRSSAAEYSTFGDPRTWALSGAANGSPAAGDTSFAVHYSGWRRDHFTAAEITLPDGTENTALAGVAANPDGDTFNNLGEYAFGGNPRQAGADPLLTTGIITEGGKSYATITFARRRGALDLLYNVEFSSDLAGWQNTGEAAGAPVPGPDGMETVTFRDTQPLSPAGRRFARVAVFAP